MGLKKTYFFVYGTLMTGHGNSRLAEEAGHLMGPAELTGEYYMSASGIPMVYEGAGFAPEGADLGPVSGELWVGKEGWPEERVLERMDMLEGHPDFYTRRLREVEFGGEKYTAWVYLMENRDYGDDPAPKNEEGRWDFRLY